MMNQQTNNLKLAHTCGRRRLGLSSTKRTEGMLRLPHLLVHLGALLAAVGFGLLSSSAVAQGPIPAPITKDGTAISLADWTQAPGTLSGGRTRINFLKEAPDNSGRLFVNDLEGVLYSVDKQTGQFTTYLDLDATLAANNRQLQTTGGLSAGFITFEFHPEFASNGKFYTVHLEDETASSPAPDFSSVPANELDKQVVLTEWTAPLPGSSTYGGTFATNTRELMRVGTGSNKHEHPMGDLSFNPLAQSGDDDYGLMYIAQGDYGMGPSGRYDLLQDANSVFGSLLRIDPLGTNSANGEYGIPAENPFVGQQDALGEVWAIGARNQHRFAWDQQDGSLYSFDVGQANVEEINLVEPGANYGWHLREGTFEINPDNLNQTPGALPANDDQLGLTYPVAQYDHDEGFSIAGGVAYRGAVPEMNGKMIFGDIVNGRLFYSNLADLQNADTRTDDGDGPAPADIRELRLFLDGTEREGGLREVVNENTGINRVDLRFGTDLDGEMYVLTKTDGWIRRLTSMTADQGLVLQVDPASGRVLIVNDSSIAIEIDGYQIMSEANALLPAAWKSLQQQGLNGWEEANVSPGQLAELNADGTLLLAGNMALDLGFSFNPQSAADLEFHFLVDGESLPQSGLVSYVELPIPGDYNGDRLVSIADYTIWRDMLGAMGTDLAADANGDQVVDQSDYLTWKANYGRSGQLASGQFAAGVPVPEPHANCLLLLGIAVVAGQSAKRWRKPNGVSMTKVGRYHCIAVSQRQPMQHSQTVKY